MKKFLGICITLCLLMSMLAIPALAEEVTEISFWTWRPEDTAFYDAVIADFEAANPDIKVVQNAIKNTEYNTILSAALAAGDGAPDVFMSRAYGGLRTFADSGYMLALDELMPELKDFSESARGGATSITDGKISGVPAVSQTMLCFYNTKIYEELGLSVPTTWDEFLANLEACKAAGYEALANGTKEGWCCEFLFGGVGPSFYGGDDFYNKVITGETTFMDPVFVDSVQKIKDLAPYMPDMFEGVAYTDMQANFINEISAHFVGGSYEAGYFSAEPRSGIRRLRRSGPDGGGSRLCVGLCRHELLHLCQHQKAGCRAALHQVPGHPEFGARIVSELAMVSAIPGVDVSANPFIAKVLELAKEFYPLHLPGRFPL